MLEVLNPLLYKGLCRYYGDVEIVSPGQEINWEAHWYPVPGTHERTKRRDVYDPGEEYRIRCKLCRDDRARLYINHMWGVPDPETDSRNLWLAHCFNEECYSEYDNQYSLFRTVYAMTAGTKALITIMPGVKEELRRLQNMPAPGPTWRLDQLMQKLPKCDVIEYLVGRGFDPVKLGKLWNVGFCPHSRYSYASNRIIIPFWQQGMHVGWQARYVGDSVDGVPFNKAKVPKYWTCPGMPKRLIAYNIERALRHSTVVVVEGPADVWNTGPCGIGVIGKTMSPQIREMLCNGMQKHGDDALVAVVLDPKQDPKEIQRNKPHPIDKLTLQLFQPMNGHVIGVRLPEEYDPGSIDRQWLRELIKEEASKNRLKATFAKPTA